MEKIIGFFKWIVSLSDRQKPVAMFLLGVGVTGLLMGFIIKDQSARLTKQDIKIDTLTSKNEWLRDALANEKVAGAQRLNNAVDAQKNEDNTKIEQIIERNTENVNQIFKLLKH